MKRRIEFIRILEKPLRVEIRSSNNPGRFFKITIPSQQAFEELIIQLASLTNLIGSNTDQLELSIDALHAVTDYLRESGEIRLSEICQPLINILSAAEDTLNGASSPLLQRRLVPKGGRPTDLTIYRTRASIVVAIDVLIQAGTARGDALKYVVQRLKNFGIVNPITNCDYTISELNGLRTKVRDATGAEKLLEHHKTLNSEGAEPLRAQAALQGDPKVTASNILRAAALMSPTSPDAQVVNADVAKEQPPDPTSR